MPIFFSTFILIFLTELADKSRLAGLFLVSLYRAPWPIFWGMTIGYAVLEALAVTVGGAVPHFVAGRWISLGAGILFLISGSAVFLFGEKAEEKANQWMGKFKKWGPFLLSFVAIATTEMGDRTQVATLALSAESGQPWAVFSGGMTAFIILNGLTVWLGERVARRMSKKLINKIGGILFLLFGVIFLLQYFR
jgi:Ca2+/H+ antiporter, TMEM165/GDT1 family